MSTIGRLHLSGAPATAAHRPRSVSSKFDVTATAGKLGRRRFGCRPTWFFDYRRNERFGSTGPTGPTGPTRPTKPERTRPTKPERTRPTKPERTRPTKQERTRPTKQERTRATKPEWPKPTKPEQTRSTELTGTTIPHL